MESSTQPTATPKKQRFKWLLLLLILVIISAVAVYSWYTLYGRWYEKTDDAYVNGNLVQITSQIDGTVISIGADDGNLVLHGQPLINLDPNDSEVALQQAAASLANTVRRVRSLYSNVDSYKAQLKSSRISVQKAQTDLARRRQLVRQGAISQEELSHAISTLETAQAHVINIEQQLQSNTAFTDNTTLETHPDILMAAAQYKQTYLNHLRSQLAAPVTGYVAKRTVQVGQHIEKGKPLMAIVPLNQVWVDANFKETQLSQVRIGQEVELTADLYGKKTIYHGRIETLGVGTGSAFALLPAQNATGNWIKIVQRLPVRVALDPQELEKNPLRIGLSMTVKVNLKDQSGTVLPTTAPQQPVLSTDIYQTQLAQADQLIKQIFEQNAKEISQ